MTRRKSFDSGPVGSILCGCRVLRRLRPSSPRANRSRPASRKLSEDDGEIADANHAVLVVICSTGHAGAASNKALEEENEVADPDREVVVIVRVASISEAVMVTIDLVVRRDRVRPIRVESAIVESVRNEVTVRIGNASGGGRARQ